VKAHACAVCTTISVVIEDTPPGLGATASEMDFIHRSAGVGSCLENTAERATCSAVSAAARSTSAWVDNFDVIATRGGDHAAGVEDMLACPTGGNWLGGIVLLVILVLDGAGFA
jgi:hypothetical protein